VVAPAAKESAATATFVASEFGSQALIRGLCYPFFLFRVRLLCLFICFTFRLVHTDACLLHKIPGRCWIISTLICTTTGTGYGLSYVGVNYVSTKENKLNGTVWSHWYFWSSELYGSQDGRILGWRSPPSPGYVPSDPLYAGAVNCEVLNKFKRNLWKIRAETVSLS
jgi:hypothetical protein